MPKQLISKAIGIDLGTTNSVVAIMDPTDTEVILHRDAITKRETTPSCVWKDPKNLEVVVGRKARSRTGHTPLPIRSIKRQMGRREQVRLTNEDVTAEEVSAYILREMKRQIEEDITAAPFQTDAADWMVDRAIITVPAYFDMPQIEATRKAGELAGLQVLELLHEPTAAACYHCFRRHIQDGVFMVYDLGGGTFDVSILRCTAGSFEVLGISGNNYLGGDDIDAVLAKHLLEQLQQQHYSLDLDLEHDEKDRLLFDILKVRMESVKKALSVNHDFLLRDTSLFDKNNEQIEIESLFERKDIEALMFPLIQPTIKICYEALKKAEEKAGITLADVDAIILAGGSTHIPFVRELVRKTFCAASDVAEPRAKCTEPVYENVDSIVALGAALRAGAVGGLVIYPSERSMRVSFQGMGATSAKQAHVGGQVEVLDPAIDLTGGYVRLTIPGLFEEESDLSKSGSFRFMGVPLQSRAENLLRVEIYNAHHTLLAAVGRSVAHDPDAPSTGIGGDTNTLSKPISLEVVHGAKVVHQELLKALQKLPHVATYTFAHPGGTEHIRFSLYQHHRKIKEVSVPIPAATPRGTPITFDIEVDKLANISCRGTIGTVPFEFTVEPPEDRQITKDDLIAQDKRFNELSLEQQNKIRKDWEEVKVNAGTSVEFGDQAKAAHEIGRSEELLGLAGDESKSLQPPKEKFMQLVQECVELVEYAARAALHQGKPFDAIGVKNSIEEQRRHGEMAFEAGDQRAYKNACDMLDSLAGHMARLVNDGLPLSVQIGQFVQYMKRFIADVKPLAEAKGRSDLLSQLAGIDRELQKIDQNPGRDSLPTLQQLSKQVEQIDSILKGAVVDVPEKI